MQQHENEQEPSYIIESKKRCIELGMDPNEIRIPKKIMSELELAEKKESYKEILEVVLFFSKKIITSLEGTPILIVISDDNGYLLETIGDETINAAFLKLGIKPGIKLSEEDMGTNVVSLTLKQKHPVQLIGTNHYHSFLHNSACYGVPFHYADDNNLLGSISIMTGIILHNPFFLMSLTTVVDAIERELLLRKQNKKLSMMINENKKLLQQTIEYDNLKIEFFGNISHELRTPLNIILNAIQLLDTMNNNVTDSNCQSFIVTFQKYIKIMRQNGHRLLRLINNIIDLTKIDSGFSLINFNNHNIVAVVENITLSVADYIRSKGLELIFDTDVEEKIIACDEEKIERIMLNLLSNATKYSKTGGTINVDIKDLDTEVMIIVQDTGVGIPSDKLDVIFQRFRQVDELLTRRAEGSGIGLSLVKSLVEAHKGTINVSSIEGVGSKFAITLPATVLQDNEKSDEVSDKALDNIYFNDHKKKVIETINIEFSDIYK